MARVPDDLIWSAPPRLRSISVWPRMSSGCEIYSKQCHSHMNGVVMQIELFKPKRAEQLFFSAEK